MIYILVICIVVLVIISIRTFNDLKRNRERKKWEELKKKEQADREFRLAPLEKEKQKVDKNLSIEKNVKCDDGITRIYKNSMLGIIREFQNKFTVSHVESTDDVNADVLQATSNKYIIISREISNVKWFSWSGKKLKADEILKYNERYHSLQRRYNEKFKELLWTMKTNGPSYRKLNLICINDYYFITNSDLGPKKLFSGTIDGVTYINGLAIQNEIDNTKMNEMENLSSKKINGKLIEQSQALYGVKVPNSIEKFNSLEEKEELDEEFEMWIAMARTIFLDDNDNTFEALELKIEFLIDTDGGYEIEEQIKKELNYEDLVFIDYQNENGDFKLQKVINCPGIQDTYYDGDGGNHGPYSSVKEAVDFLRNVSSVDFNDLDLSTDSLDLFLS